MARSKAVKLSSLNKKAIYQSVVFFISPELTEGRNVTWAEVSDLRLPASILIYMGSPSRNFSINAKFLARSQAEADVAFRNMNLLKSWCVTSTDPYLGTTSNVTLFDPSVGLAANDAQSAGDVSSNLKQDNTHGIINRGNTPNVNTVKTNTATVANDLFSGTPPVLVLEGYGQQYRKIPVVITSLSIPFTGEVDYIKSSGGAYVPILQEISISLKEARNVFGKDGSSIDSFNLASFKAGLLPYW